VVDKRSYGNGISVWTHDTGTRDFLRWPGDGTRGAADLGTDGVDMAWTYGEGKADRGRSYPRRSIMTAPFTSDPTALKPRRLRSAPHSGVGNWPWLVGCGYAAHQGAVRLRDGVSWLVPSSPRELELTTPLGITCEEIVAQGRVGGRLTIVRVKLASLGDGMPPD
jgi:hypothetical protein